MTRKPRRPHHPIAQRAVEPATETDRSLIHRVWPPLEAFRHHRHRNPRLYRNGGRGLVVLICFVAIVSGALYIVGRIDTMRLAGSAAIQITSAVPFGGSAFDQSPAGTTIRYTYSVDGTLYSGVDFRRWLNVAAHDPKVCFDPSNPASHALVEGSYRCGTGP